MEFYVRKIHVGARVSQPNLHPRDGHFQLAPTVESGDRPEALLDLLNSPRTVIPFILTQDAEVLLLTRANIDWVMVGMGVEPDLIYPPGSIVSAEQRVELRLVDESRVQAVVRWHTVGGVRLSDHLNRDEPFFAAKTDFGPLLVNKLRVRELRVLENAPQAVTPFDQSAPGDPRPAAIDGRAASG